jgi:hypothetical protein
MMILRTILITIALCFAHTSWAQSIQLKPHKDKLFAYPKVLESARNGNFLRVDYIKARDIYERDEIPLRRAHFKYVDRGIRWSRRVRTYTSPNGKFKFFSTGKHRSGAKVTVVWVHGQGGNRFQGVNDWTFGGNFNRLQNLMAKNASVLLSPEFTDFKDKGAQDIAALITEFRRRSPKTKLIVACGSMGGGICWRLASSKQMAPLISGMFILGSHWYDGFLKSPPVTKASRPIPLYFGHGSWDSVFKPERQKQFYEAILKKNPSYPVRFTMFETGKHGTPIRMVDWRRELNWMLSY